MLDLVQTYELCSPPGSSVHGILQARILEWTAIPFSGVFQTHGSNRHVQHLTCIGRRVLYHKHLLRVVTHDLENLVQKWSNDRVKTLKEIMDLSITVASITILKKE